MSDKRVVAIVVNYNSGPLLAECLAGLLAQSRPADRIVVVDNASSDDSLDDFERRFPTVDLLRQNSNLGFAAANNLAVRADPTADWLALVNPDAVPRPDWLAELLAAAEQHPECASLASLTLNASRPEEIDGAGDAYHASGLAWRSGHGQLLSNWQPRSWQCFSACAAAALYRAAVWNQLGGLCEDYFCYHEDVDLGFRLRLAGHDCRLVPAAIALHHGSAITGLDSEFSLFHGHRNLVWTFFRNMPWPLLLLLAPAHLLAQLYLVLGYRRRGKAGPVVRAFARGWAGLPQHWRERRAIQRQRKASTLAIARALNWWPRRWR